MKTRRFSVITITKNNPAGFNKTQLSVESQLYSDFEWIVIDGEKEPDNGIYDAMNKGLDRAKGAYVLFLNAGDEFADQNALQRLADYDADFIYGDYIERGHVVHAKPHDMINSGMVTSHQAMAYNRSVIGDLRYDMRYSLAADYKFTLQFLQKAETVHQVDFPICIFETGGVSQHFAKQARQEEKAVRSELGIKAPWTVPRQWLALIVKSFSYRLYLKLRAIVHNYS